MKIPAIRFVSLALVCLAGAGYANAESAMAESWPRDSSGSLVSGTAVVVAIVKSDGQVASATIDKSSGYRELDEDALITVKKWHFQPQAGKDVPDRKVLIPVHLDPSHSPSAGSSS